MSKVRESKDCQGAALNLRLQLLLNIPPFLKQLVDFQRNGEYLMLWVLTNLSLNHKLLQRFTDELHVYIMSLPYTGLILHFFYPLTFLSKVTQVKVFHFQFLLPSTQKMPRMSFTSLY